MVWPPLTFNATLIIYAMLTTLSSLVLRVPSIDLDAAIDHVVQAVIFGA